MMNEVSFFPQSVISFVSPCSAIAFQKSSRYKASYGHIDSMCKSQPETWSDCYKFKTYIVLGPWGVSYLEFGLEVKEI